MDQKALAALLFPDVTETPEDLEARYPARDLPEGAVVTRMAPSPTGFVHLGNLVQGLVAERMAHQSGGVLFLRVEDTDAKREVPGAVEVLINTLKHYGIHFDEGATIDGDSGAYGPYRQRQRAAIYHVYAKQLVLREAAHPLVQYGGDGDIGIAIAGQILISQLFQAADSGDVLHQVAALAIAHGDVLDALLSARKSEAKRS